eukprot:MONOS_14692.1-p1 / transcript=MONOS_14692.1 / gene=MONOS_14692 / organism=Monocercomonoides_exilis_PA203 / gene_product=unspecified product / transcript_product=unspecified product / location=Mono_scaffold01052:9502-11104(-) / protein_length=508 / sequence_SO=supercontig / SO=protein_coding / is_pseudo=false
MSTQVSSFINSCSFWSVFDAYDGGIVPSLNNPFASLTASNTSFIGCYRTRNVKCEGTSDNIIKPDRQNETENGANTFSWCEWNGSKTTGTNNDHTDDSSNGGAIRMFSLENGELYVSHCSFNGCTAYAYGGGVMCHTIKSVISVNNFFNSCTARYSYGGGLYSYSISACARISGCEFQNCKANSQGGGLKLESFQVSGTGCIGTENEGDENACVFDCSFTSCSITNTLGGGMFCKNVPATEFKMRSIQFISCSAASHGGGLCFAPWKDALPSDKLYCFFIFFHNCSCSRDQPYGADLYYEDYYSKYLNSDSPFKECYTTNTEEKRVCYAYNYTGNSWSYQYTEKKDWLTDKTIYVSVNGNDNLESCGANESNPCLTVKKAFEIEATTIEIGEKKISVIGKGKDKSLIGTGALSSVGILFSVSTGHLGLLHMKVDCNSTADFSSPSVVVVSDGGGSLSLEDVVITTSKTGGYVMSSSVFVVVLSQLSMVGVEIKDTNITRLQFCETEL